MRKGLILIIVFFVTSTLSAQEQKFQLLKDTTIFFNELTFNSLLEKEIFQKVYLDKSTDYFTLLYLVRKGADTNAVEQAKAILNKEISTFKEKKSKGKKLVKKIYSDVHKKFFKKYELYNHFDDVFEKGYYNCLSATAIYALILDELEIPYQINILPAHVNLTAYPNSEKIIIETTDPVKGYFTYDKKFKERFVYNLVAYKLIEEKDIQLRSIDNVFEEFYNTKDNVSLKQLVGTQYYNDGLYLLEKENYEEAIQQLEKSVALYPSFNSASVLLSAYLNELVDAEYKEKKEINYLIKALRYSELKSDITEGVVGEVARVGNNSVINNKDTVAFKEFYNTLYNSIDVSTAIKKSLDIVYWGVLGEYYFKDLEYKTASQYFKNALKISGKDTLNLEDLYTRSILLHTEGAGDVEGVLTFLIESEYSWPELKQNKLFMSYKAEVLSMIMIRKFERNKIKEGEHYRTQLEEILDNVEIKKNEHNLGIAYAEAGSAYYRLGNRTKAKNLFKKGLFYCPNHSELKYRLSLVNY